MFLAATHVPIIRRGRGRTGGNAPPDATRAEHVGAGRVGGTPNGRAIATESVGHDVDMDAPLMESGLDSYNMSDLADDLGRPSGVQVIRFLDGVAPRPP